MALKVNKKGLFNMDKFKNYYDLKKYLSVVAYNNNHKINFDDYDGLEIIYSYLMIHKEKIVYNFNFTERIKLVTNNDVKELKNIWYWELYRKHAKIDDFVINSIGLKLHVRTNIEKDMICTYSRPIMTTNIGCYFIYDNNNELIYIGKSNNDLLLRSCTSANQRISWNFNHIELKEYSTKAETNIFEIYYISKYKPKFNSESNTKDVLPFDLPDTSISTQYINVIDKKIFNSKNSEEYIMYKQYALSNNMIIFEIEKGHSYRPIIPLKWYLRNMKHTSKKFYQD